MLHESYNVQMSERCAKSRPAQGLYQGPGASSNKISLRKKLNHKIMAFSSIAS